MKKSILIFSLFGFILQTATAQLKLSLNMLSDNETYVVSMLTEQTINAPLNTTSNIQIVLQILDNEVFTAGNIQSLISGITWKDNAYSDELDLVMPNLIVFNMVERSTTALPFIENQETPLFTFKNAESDCVGILKLVNNSDEAVQTAVANGYNYTQNFTVLAARGNAFSGLLNAEVDCNNLNTSITETLHLENVKIYPIPTQADLTIEWESAEQLNNLELTILNVNGQLVDNRKNIATNRENLIKLSIDNYPVGIYIVRFQAAEKVSREYKFIVGKGK